MSTPFALVCLVLFGLVILLIFMYQRYQNKLRRLMQAMQTTKESFLRDGKQRGYSEIVLGHVFDMALSYAVRLRGARFKGNVLLDSRLEDLGLTDRDEIEFMLGDLGRSFGIKWQDSIPEPQTLEDIVSLLQTRESQELDRRHDLNN